MKFLIFCIFFINILTALICQSDTQSLDTKYAIGDDLHLCLFLSFNPDSTIVKSMNFVVKIDKHQSLKLNDALNMISLSTTNPKQTRDWASALDKPTAFVWISRPTLDARPLDCEDAEDISNRSHIVSCPVAWSRNGYTAPFLNLAFNLKNDGIIDSMVWDNRCYGCSGDACIKSPLSIKLPSAQLGFTLISPNEVRETKGMCGKKHGPMTEADSCVGLASSATNSTSTSVGAVSNDGPCELRVYLTFAGSTSGGTLAKSGNLSYSRYASSTVSDPFDSFIAKS
eukprot:GDKJ01009527.1.p1 GENE.GDKJ01009527.1~~GDKJ01009527.1.p1  ORF type:complete len:284 (+),score=34.05 GDKJ01009527.1:14-865(+)